MTIKMENRFMKCSTRNMRICAILRNKRRNNSALDHCLVCHPYHDNKQSRAFMATNRLIKNIVMNTMILISLSCHC